MSDKMRQIPFAELMRRVIVEYRTKQTVFQVSNIYKPEEKKHLLLFERPLENPFGPAAGPHTQLAQNIIAAYAGGSRFFELKTVQILDGDNLHVDKPCIRAEDECYNVEWSTELYVQQAFEEYVKAWYACKLLAKEFGFGDPNGFQFNMSVGYDLKGIQSEKVDNFIEGMKDASTSAIWKECEAFTLQNLNLFENINESYVKAIPSKICNSITLSTMHGCPASEIEKITTYLLEEKKINTYLKCNPTLLGYEFTRNIMDEMGYDYLVFDNHHFNEDLQFDDAIIMIKKLQQLASQRDLKFGVKLSNTFPVGIARNELPGQEMYMSGKSLFPLTIHLALKLAKAFNGNLAISFSGGADMCNIKDIFETGIWPITVATTLLKPMGYQKIKGLAQAVDVLPYEIEQKLNIMKLEELAMRSKSDMMYRKNAAIKNKELVKFDVNRKEGIQCKVVCGSCMHVCPNRANAVIQQTEGKLLLHIDDFCNECGNCYFFCPDKCTPYKDRVTLYSSRESFDESTNQGFVLLGDEVLYRYEGTTNMCTISNAPEVLNKLIKVLQKDYPYLLSTTL